MLGTSCIISALEECAKFEEGRKECVDFVGSGKLLKKLPCCEAMLGEAVKMGCTCCGFHCKAYAVDHKICDAGLRDL